MMRSTTLALAAFAAALASSCADRGSEAPPACLDTAAGCALRELADPLGVYVGAAFVEGSDDPEFRRRLPIEFNSTTAGVYWSSTEPAPGRHDFTGPDAALAAAESGGLRVRGHPLFWGRLALPEWVRPLSPEALRAAMRERARVVMGRYHGRIAEWDAVNEPITFYGDDGGTGGLDRNAFSLALGPGWVREALDVAHAADPEARLFVNEFGVLAPGPKQERFFALVRDLVASGAPLAGVGFQGHVDPPFLPGFVPTEAEVRATIERFAALGLAVEITEADVTLYEPITTASYARQGEIYRDLAAGCFASPACTGFTVWGMSDRDTWIRRFFGVVADPLLFDRDFAPKPAYFGVRDALAEALGERR